MFAAISALTTTLHYEKHKSKVITFTKPLSSHLLTIMLVSMLALLYNLQIMPTIINLLILCIVSSSYIHIIIIQATEITRALFSLENVLKKKILEAVCWLSPYYELVIIFMGGAWLLGSASIQELSQFIENVH